VPPQAKVVDLSQRRGSKPEAPPEPPQRNGSFLGEPKGPEATVFNLLLIILLAGILTAMCLPAFRGFALRVHNKLARQVLEQAFQRQREWRKLPTWQGFYSLEALDYPAPAVYVSSDGRVRGSANAGSIYRVSVAFPAEPTPESCGLVADDPRSGFVLVAEPIQTQRIDALCGRLCLSSSGQRAVSGDAGAARCWNTSGVGADELKPEALSAKPRTAPWRAAAPATYPESAGRHRG
jgi:Tfp pilus assembly protein PilE